MIIRIRIMIIIMLIRIIIRVLVLAATKVGVEKLQRQGIQVLGAVSSSVTMRTW